MKQITLATLEQATEQEVFDQVAKHLLTQKQKSAQGAHCKYKHHSGLTCAAGCLISESEYDEKFEGAAWNGLVQLGKVPSAHHDLIDLLQMIHDDTEVSDWEYQLQTLAGRRDLQFKVTEKSE